MTQEALKLALEALEEAWYHVGTFQPTEKAIDLYDEARAAIKEALAQTQEPVAHLWECIGRWSAYLVSNGKQANCAPPSWLVDAVNNATTPPQRTWVGLTDEEITGLHHEIKVRLMGTYKTEDIYRAIEAKLKEKNT